MIHPFVIFLSLDFLLKNLLFCPLDFNSFNYALLSLLCYGYNISDTCPYPKNYFSCCHILLDISIKRSNIVIFFFRKSETVTLRQYSLNRNKGYFPTSCRHLVVASFIPLCEDRNMVEES